MKRNEQEWKDLSSDLKFLGLYNPEVINALKRASDMRLESEIQRLTAFKPDYCASYTLKFYLDPARGWLLPDSYTANVRVTRPVTHGMFEGVDSAYLDRALSMLSWDKEDSLSLLGGGRNSELSSVIAEHAQQLINLLKSDDPAAKDTGERLAARYWVDTPMEVMVDLSVVAKKYSRRYEFPIESLQTAINVQRATNLLCGRSVTTLSDELKPTWAYMDLSKSDPQLVYVQDYPFLQLLAGLPVKELQEGENFVGLMADLMAGERAKAQFGNELVYVEADAFRKELTVRDKEGRIITLEGTIVDGLSIDQDRLKKFFEKLPVVPAERRSQGNRL